MNKFLQLAPMQAMTDNIFMNTYHTIFGGFTEMMAPYLMASSKSFIKETRLDKLYQELIPEIKMIPQLLSNEAEGFLHYAHLLNKKGYHTVNWNLGCPFPTVTKKQRGAGLLPFPEKIEKVLIGLENKLEPQLSIKIRLGMYQQEEILPIIDIINQFSVKEVIIHPRTGMQKYEGKADIDFFGKIYQRVKAPVVFNGDIVRKEQIDALDQLFPDIKGYMIGRGAFINPFITNQINGIKLSDIEKREKYQQLYTLLFDYYLNKTLNIEGFLCRMKELWYYFSQSFENGHALLKELRTTNELDNFEHKSKNIFENEKLIF